TRGSPHGSWRRSARVWGAVRDPGGHLVLTRAAGTGKARGYDTPYPRAFHRWRGGIRLVSVAAACGSGILSLSLASRSEARAPRSPGTAVATSDPATGSIGAESPTEHPTGGVPPVERRIGARDRRPGPPVPERCRRSA